MKYFVEHAWIEVVPILNSNPKPWFKANAFTYLLLLCTLFAGCQSGKQSKNFGKSIFGTYADAQAHLREYQQVVLVEINQTRREDQGPNKYGLLHFSGTVIKTFKGKWSPGEHIAFVHGVDYRVSNATNTNVSQKIFVFANAYQSAEFSVETGDFLSYDTELNRQLRILFPDQN